MNKEPVPQPPSKSPSFGRSNMIARPGAKPIAQPDPEKPPTPKQAEPKKTKQPKSTDQWFDIMPDGLARGYPGDTNVMRYQFRTPAAIRRKAELEGAGTQETKDRFSKSEKDKASR